MSWFVDGERGGVMFLGFFFFNLERLFSGKFLYFLYVMIELRKN